MYIMYTIFMLAQRIFYAIAPRSIAAWYRGLSFVIRLGFSIAPRAEADLFFAKRLLVPPLPEPPCGQGTSEQAVETPTREVSAKRDKGVLRLRKIKPTREFPVPSTLNAKVYLPPGRVHSRTRTIIAIHGFAESGYDDHRIMEYARAVSSASDSIVVLPHFDAFVNCVMTRPAVDAVRAAIEATAADSQICPTGKVSLSSFCVCCGFASIAAAEAGDLVEAICCVGSYADMSSLVEFCIKEQGKGDSCYGANSMLMNLWQPGNEALMTVFLTALSDDHHLRKGKPDAKLPEVCEQYPEAGATFQRLYDDPAFLEQAIREAYDSHADECDSLSLTPEVLSRLSCTSATLVHALEDGIIPPTETIVLRDRLAKHGSVATISSCVTPLLNHGDKQRPSLRSIVDVYELARAFGTFMRDQTELTTTL